MKEKKKNSPGTHTSAANNMHSVFMAARRVHNKKVNFLGGKLSRKSFDIDDHFLCLL